MTPIQFGHIEIDGTVYPVKFGVAQSRDYCKALGCELKDYNAMLTADEDGKNKLSKLETNGEEMMAMVWSALKQGARVEKAAFDLTQDDAGDLIDHMNRQPEKWMEFFMIMQDGGAEVPESPNETPKVEESSKLTAA